MRTATDLKTKTKTSERHPAFEYLDSKEIKALQINIESYRHKQTGAMHYHLVADNPENVFLVAFRTVPTDSTGVAHMLEHTALCGSKSYQVRDPFFMMLRRSLNTFMNAFTSSDWTGYPFASQNEKDYFNLLDVYLDATFFSRLDPLDFAQEGHRLEFKEPDNPDTELVYKGVVYNEMKGAMSSPIDMLWHTLCEHVYPTTTYHFNSGGEPADIPNLTYEELKAFYQRHYHPSNATFLTYGNIPAIKHQHVFEEKALAHFERHQEKPISVPNEKRYKKPLKVEATYPLDEKDIANKSYILMSWLLGESANYEESIQAHFLASVLLDDSATPIRKLLETSKLGSAPAPICGLDDGNKEMSFICGLEGSSPEHVDQFEQQVLAVLNDVAENGIAFERLETALHQLEISQREITGGSYPYGLQLIMSMLPAVIHYGDPLISLDLEPVLAKLREQIKDPEFVKGLVRDLLINNPHRVTFVSNPDSTLSKKRADELAAKLADIKQTLSPEDKEKLVEQAAELKARQEEKEDPGVLPKVGLEDVPNKVSIARGSKSQIANRECQFFPQGTNGLIYQDIVIDLPQIAPALLQMLPEYTTCFTEVGVGDKDYLATQAWQSKISGGLYAYADVRGQVTDVQQLKSRFVLSGKSLQRNHLQLCELMQATLFDLRFDEHDRFKEMIAQIRASRDQSITSNGHVLAMTAASSGMSSAAALSHNQDGLAGIKFTDDLDDKIKDKNALVEFVDNLQELHQVIIDAPKQFLTVAEIANQQLACDDLQQVWQQIGANNSSSVLTLAPVTEMAKQFWVTSTQVNFCAKAFPTVPFDHPDAPVLGVLGAFLRNGYLHTAIREKGGAYGSGAGQDSDIAAFRFFSYRDPRLVETLDEFDRSIHWLLSEKHEWRQVEEAILGIVGSLDKPSSPAGEAKKAFYCDKIGRTEELRQQYRERLLAVKLDDLQRVANLYLAPQKASTAVISNQLQLDKVGDLGLQIIRL